MFPSPFSSKVLSYGIVIHAVHTLPLLAPGCAVGPPCRYLLLHFLGGLGRNDMPFPTDLRSHDKWSFAPQAESKRKEKRTADDRIYTVRWENKVSCGTLLCGPTSFDVSAQQEKKECARCLFARCFHAIGQNDNTKSE